MKGYIGIANDEWCNHLQSINSDIVIFWRKRTIFKALEKGESFYILNRKLINGQRYIIGRGEYEELKVLPAKEAWKMYGELLGFYTEKEFFEIVKTIYKTEQAVLGCIILKDFKFYKKYVSLSECEIDFSPYTVSGKIIDEEECKRLNQIAERRA